MGMMERLSTLIRANINDMLDHAEDPEIMLSQILRDMETEIGKARSQVADMMAQEKLFHDDLSAEQEKSATMQERAQHYVREGNDGMAREALKRKSDSDTNIGVLQSQLSAQSEMVGRLRSQLDALQEKYQNALSNRDNLLARYHRAQAQQQVSRTMSNLDITDYSGDLSRMEHRIRSTEARAGAEVELNSSMSGGLDAGTMFDDAEKSSKVDRELQALKSSMGMGGGETPSPKSETRNLGGTTT